jgi:hypothetical protein
MKVFSRLMRARPIAISFHSFVLPRQILPFNSIGLEINVLECTSLKITTLDRRLGTEIIMKMQPLLSTNRP